MHLHTLRSLAPSLLCGGGGGRGGAVSACSFTRLPSLKGRDTRQCSKCICIATPLLHVTSCPLRQLQQHGITENTQDEKGAHKHTHRNTVSGATPESFHRVCGMLHLAGCNVAKKKRKNKKQVLRGEASQAKRALVALSHIDLARPGRKAEQRRLTVIMDELLHASPAVLPLLLNEGGTNEKGIRWE